MKHLLILLVTMLLLLPSAVSAESLPMPDGSQVQIKLPAGMKKDYGINGELTGSARYSFSSPDSKFTVTVTADRFKNQAGAKASYLEILNRSDNTAKVLNLPGTVTAVLRTSKNKMFGDRTSDLIAYSSSLVIQVDFMNTAEKPDTQEFHRVVNEIARSIKVKK